MALAEAHPVVLFDVLGTLVHDPFFAEVPEFLGVTLQELLASKGAQAWPDFECGKINEQTLLRTFFADGRFVDGEGLKATIRKSVRWLAGMETLLAELHANGIEMHALSNYPPWYQLIEDTVHASRFLSWTFVSCKTGVRKPDRRAYLGAAGALGRTPSECLLIDDRAENCRAAINVGMPAILFQDAGALRHALVQLGLLP